MDDVKTPDQMTTDYLFRKTLQNKNPYLSFPWQLHSYPMVYLAEFDQSICATTKTSNNLDNCFEWKVETPRFNHNILARNIALINWDCLYLFFC